MIQNIQREVDKITAEKNEEVLWLKNHREKLPTQIKKLKKDKKLFENKVQQLVENKALNVEVQVEEKKIDTNAVNVTTKEEDKQVEKNTNLDVVVQTMNIPCEGSVTNSTTSLQEENKKVATPNKGNSNQKSSL